MYDNVRLSAAMRMARAACLLTQQELAEEIGVSKSVIARNEKMEMAMRADTWIRLEHAMRHREIELDLVSQADGIRLYMMGKDLDIVAMRITRAALNITQQGLADILGVSKNVVTRGERPGSIMRSDTLAKLLDKAYWLGIKLDWTPMTQDLTVRIRQYGVEKIEALHRGEPLPDEPEDELVETPLHEKLSGETPKAYKTQKRSLKEK
ncbi:helix-turn-helix domain-containing protein [Halomonas aquamarina]|uniref:helix-turn-helix transcriptional regulator n=1 Tax=Vreelandella aquamarina TaxID=77097 RepID=UPI0023589B17|nr:helix-turn-helix transcriptional regulator [Halomonas aquamarina]MDC8443663.1 helix-turn-helix domain-containing protein [Halomonas aquamarina]